MLYNRAEIRRLKRACSQAMTEARARIKEAELHYNSALWQWLRLDEQESALRAQETYLALAGPDSTEVQ